MKPFDVFIVYTSWGNGGKRRPMLVYKVRNNDIMVFPITTQYSSKSKLIQARYFAINDWSEIGLDKKSFIDTGTPYILSESSLKNIKQIGQLTQSDGKRLIEFLTGGNISED